MKKIMMVKEKNVFKTMLLKCIEMQDLHGNFFYSSILSIIFIFICLEILRKNLE